jgi:hypothetical protein
MTARPWNFASLWPLSLFKDLFACQIFFADDKDSWPLAWPSKAFP